MYSYRRTTHNVRWLYIHIPDIIKACWKIHRLVHVHPFSRRQWCYLMLFRNVWGYCGLGISCVVVWPQLVVPLQTGWFITKWIHIIQLEWAVRIFLKNCWQQILLIHVDSFCRELVVQWFLHCLIYSWNMWSAQIVRWNSSSSWTWQK